MTDDDAARLRAIIAAESDAERAQLVHEYYGSLARADRTPRAVLYLHLGMLVGMVQKAHRLLARKEN